LAGESRRRPPSEIFYPKLQVAFPDQFKNVAMKHSIAHSTSTTVVSAPTLTKRLMVYTLSCVSRVGARNDAGQSWLRDLPEAWNAKEAYLGVDVSNDAGCLAGHSLGWKFSRLFSDVLPRQHYWAQIWEKFLPICHILRNSASEFLPLREWLRDHIYKHGRKFTPQEMCQRVLGGPIDVGPFVQYLKLKYAEIYGV
jgi:carboxypeptidase Taq